MAELAAVLKNMRSFVICDEVYSELTYTGEAHVSMASRFILEQAIVINGLSDLMPWQVGDLALSLLRLYWRLNSSESSVFGNGCWTARPVCCDWRHLTAGPDSHRNLNEEEYRRNIRDYIIKNVST